MTWNSYASRHYDAQGNLIDDTVVLHEQYMAAHPSPTPATNEDASQFSGSPAESVSPSEAPAESIASPTEFPAPSISEEPVPSAS